MCQSGLNDIGTKQKIEVDWEREREGGGGGGERKGGGGREKFKKYFIDFSDVQKNVHEYHRRPEKRRVVFRSFS